MSVWKTHYYPPHSNRWIAADETLCDILSREDLMPMPDCRVAALLAYKGKTVGGIRDIAQPARLPMFRRNRRTIIYDFELALSSEVHGGTGAYLLLEEMERCARVRQADFIVSTIVEPSLFDLMTKFFRFREIRFQPAESCEYTPHEFPFLRKVFRCVSQSPVVRARAARYFRRPAETMFPRRGPRVNSSSVARPYKGCNLLA